MRAVEELVAVMLACAPSPIAMGSLGGASCRNTTYVVDRIPSCSRVWPALLKIAQDQRRMRQRTSQVVNVAIGLVVEQHDQLRGSEPPKLSQLILQPVIEHPSIGWKIDEPSRFCVGQQPVALKSGSVAEHCAELPGGSFQAAHGRVCKLGWIDILAGKDL